MRFPGNIEQQGGTMAELLIIGGGYAGVWAAMGAAWRRHDSGLELNIHLLSRDGFLTHRPRLYERNPGALQTPLDAVLAPIGVELNIAEVTAIAAEQRTVRAQDEQGPGGGISLRWPDPGGGRHRPPPWQVRNGRTWSIDTHADAVALDRHLASLKEGPGTDTVVIVGAGFTGLELATEMRIRLAEHLGSERAERARIILLEAAVTVSEELGPGPRPHIEAALQAAKVELRLDTTIEWIDGDRVFLNDGARITAPTVIVTTGPRANGLAAGFGLPTDPAGRLPVDKNLAVKGLRNIHAAGDIAHAMTDADHVALMSCQHAMPMGRYAGHNAAAALLGLPMRPYEQERYVTCLDLGPWGAVFTNGWARQVVSIEQEAKARKRYINTEAIYPPTNDREAILEAGAIP
jgi:NADH dehydrogenase